MKKYKLFIMSFIFVFVLCILIYLLLNRIDKKDNSLKPFIKNTYSLMIDDTWKVTDSTDEKIILKHKTEDSYIEININKLEEDLEYYDIDELIDNIVYNISQDNKKYKLINKSKELVTKKEYHGYKILFEDDNSNVLLTVFKKEDKLIIIKFISPIDVFDILLDSVNNIINEFDTTYETFDLNSSINIKYSDINYIDYKEIDYSSTKEYFLASNNYYVKYNIPSIFSINDYNSINGSFNYKDDNGNIYIYTSILNYNVFEYLDRNKSINVYRNYYSIKNDKSNSNFEENINKLEDDLYIYKNSYNTDVTFNKGEYSSLRENITLIKSLNKNHIMIINIKGEGIPLTKELVNSIKFNEIKNYSTFKMSEIKGESLVFSLKAFTDYSKNKVNEIDIILSKKYNEISNNMNIYTERKFGLNYDKDSQLYDYEVKYDLSIYSDISSKVKNVDIMINKSYGKYELYKKSKDFTYNDKKFIVYSGGYTNISGIMFTNIDRKRYYVYKELLFYKLNNGKYFIIEVTGNGKKITDEVLKEITNFETSIKERGI